MLLDFVRELNAGFNVIQGRTKVVHAFSTEDDKGAVDMSSVELDLVVSPLGAPRRGSP